ncbi:MAG: response regulator transcription factor [Lachnospiraceae bacterium]|jgi:DNA-binding response OmpR family regulator|nr:response regulator transcription factor [Lachnospiraceae bacterium]MBP5564871.1 response regulator transcription factor [Lachnospiraceae bacterium]MBQ4275502.1 response regulator transcription factor [Lachnospiraceae bacterium]MCR4696025.1 response regulator transcription factor [Lachnospiraceae bacterium]
MIEVLIVEDDLEIRKLLANFLSEKGMNITEAKDGDIAYDYIQDKSFDIILLDMMLPYKTGEELIKILRNNKSKDGNTYTPVIVISAKTELDTRLNAIQSGADDYITKPFDLNEVYVRIEALLRRSEGGEYVKKDDNEVLEALGVVFNVSDNEVTYEGKPIKLTAKEMKLLLLFMQNPKKTFTKANLYKSVWEDEYIYEDNTINVHMSNLRKKLAEATGKDVIETVWGIGYRLKEEE